MNRNKYFRAGILAQITFAFQASVYAESQQIPHTGYANSEIHPYADPNGGREGYLYANAPVNKERLYDFYARQADYYNGMDNAPNLLPAFPGLDAGKYGHWGKNNDFANIEDRWSPLQNGPILGSVLRFDGQTIGKALCIQFPESSEAGAIFDPVTLSYRGAWIGDFLKYSSIRWGLLGNPKPGGKTLFSNHFESKQNSTDKYIGYYVNGNSVVFKYAINGSTILDMPRMAFSSSSWQFSRTIELPSGSGKIKIPVLQSDSMQIVDPRTAHAESVGIKLLVTFEDLNDSLDSTKFVIENDRLFLITGKTNLGSLLELVISTDFENSPTDRNEKPKPSRLIEGGEKRWPLALNLPKSYGESVSGYAVDTITVPLTNPYSSPMFLSGLAFFSNGNAAVSTFFGDIWIVSGLADSETSATWSRFASGLNHPLGLEVIDDTLYAIGRDQLTALHDLNNDGEADFYENMFNDFQTHSGTHDFNTGLARDEQGNVYFASTPDGVRKIDSKFETISVLSTGIRNPNGITLTAKGVPYTSTQEGDWTPATMIVAATKDSFYGYRSEFTKQSIDAPLSFIPRGIDNSAGGLSYIEGKDWGPYNASLLGLSYGYASSYIVLSNESKQSAILPLRGEFLSGVHRAKFSPTNGQLYVVGTQGWGNYAQFDGCLQRIRYTGEAIYYPTDFTVFENGIQVTFDSEVDIQLTEKIERYFCQQWNYRYSPSYGSPEYSVRTPSRIGHDRVTIRSVVADADTNSIFVEIPEILPAMQTHLRLRIPFSDGTEFKSELLITALELAPPFTNASNLAKLSNDKPKHLNVNDFVTKTRKGSSYE